MAGEVGLGQKAQAGDSPGAGKLVPAGLTDGAKAKISDDLAEERLQHLVIAKGVRTASLRIDNPFDPMHRL